MADPDLLQQGPHRLTSADQISTAGRRPVTPWGLGISYQDAVFAGIEAAIKVGEQITRRDVEGQK